MSSKNGDGDLEAQRIALTHLVRGCEDAVSELIRDGGEPTQATKKAREILAEMLSTWRRTLAALSPAE